MINQFRKPDPINLLLLLGYTFFMCTAVYAQLPERLNFEFIEPFVKLLIHIPLENAFSPATNVTLAALLTYVQAIVFNRVINNHNLLSKPSYLPALMYITSASLFMPFLTLSPTLLCNFLLIWMIDKFLKVGKTGNALMMMFDVGMIVAIGTLIYFPFISMILMVWLSLLLYRSFNWREWISGLVGFLTVMFFLAVFYYWNDNIGSFYKIWLPLANKFPSVFKVNYNDYMVLIPVIIIMVLAGFQLQENFFRSFISTRKAFQMLFFMFIIGLGSFYLKPDFRITHFLLAAPAGSVLLAYYFSNAKKRWFYETLFVLFVFSIQYFLFV